MSAPASVTSASAPELSWGAQAKENKQNKQIPQTQPSEADSSSKAPFKYTPSQNQLPPELVGINIKLDSICQLSIDNLNGLLKQAIERQDADLCLEIIYKIIRLWQDVSDSTLPADLTPLNCLLSYLSSDSDSKLCTHVYYIFISKFFNESEEALKQAKTLFTQFSTSSLFAPLEKVVKIKGDGTIEIAVCSDLTPPIACLLIEWSLGNYNDFDTFTVFLGKEADVTTAERRRIICSFFKDHEHGRISKKSNTSQLIIKRKHAKVDSQPSSPSLTSSSLSQPILIRGRSDSLSQKATTPLHSLTTSFGEMYLKPTDPTSPQSQTRKFFPAHTKESSS